MHPGQCSQHHGQYKLAGMLTILAVMLTTLAVIFTNLAVMLTTYQIVNIPATRNWLGC